MGNDRYDDRLIATGTTFLALVMFVVGFLYGHPAQATADIGICFPSPGSLALPPFPRFIADLILLCGCAGGMLMLNRQYLFARNVDLLLPALFLLGTASVPATVGSPDAILQAAVMTLVAALMLPSYKSPRPEANAFTAASLISVGAMFSAWMVLAVPFLFLMMVSVKILTPRSTGAVLLGLVSPWWIVLGTGIAPIQELRFPETATVFNLGPGEGPDLAAWLFIGLTALIGFLAALGQEMRTYLGNVRSRQGARLFLWIFTYSCLGIIVDTSAWQSYTATLCLGATVGITRLFPSDNNQRMYPVIGGVSLLYLLVFILSLTLGQPGTAP